MDQSCSEDYQEERGGAQQVCRIAAPVMTELTLFDPAFNRGFHPQKSASGHLSCCTAINQSTQVLKHNDSDSLT